MTPSLESVECRWNGRGPTGDAGRRIRVLSKHEGQSSCWMRCRTSGVMNPWSDMPLEIAARYTGAVLRDERRPLLVPGDRDVRVAAGHATRDRGRTQHLSQKTYRDADAAILGEDDRVIEILGPRPIVRARAVDDLRPLPHRIQPRHIGIWIERVDGYGLVWQHHKVKVSARRAARMTPPRRPSPNRSASLPTPF